MQSCEEIFLLRGLNNSTYSFTSFYKNDIYQNTKPLEHTIDHDSTECVIKSVVVLAPPALPGKSISVSPTCPFSIVHCISVLSNAL
jgi:hypothetical protein